MTTQIQTELKNLEHQHRIKILYKDYVQQFEFKKQPDTERLNEFFRVTLEKYSK